MRENWIETVKAQWEFWTGNNDMGDRAAVSAQALYSVGEKIRIRMSIPESGSAMKEPETLACKIAK